MAGFLCSTATSAEEVTWNISFLDPQHLSIGSGQFTYDPTTTKTISSLVSHSFDVDSLLTSISVETDGKAWGSRSLLNSAGIRWWNTPMGAAPGSNTLHRFTSFVQNSWTFYRGETVEATAGVASSFQALSLVMSNFRAISPTLWIGDWESGRTAELSDNQGLFIVTQSAPVLPHFSFSTGELSIPTVMVEQMPYAVKMHVNPDDNPLTFTVIEAVSAK